MKFFKGICWAVALLAPLTATALDVEKTTLKNGMDVYVVEDHRFPVVVNFVWYNAGAADEVDGETGIAHMLEHLMFKGTEHIPAGEFSKIVAEMAGKTMLSHPMIIQLTIKKSAKQNCHS